MISDAWRNRPLEVKVLEHCTERKTLKPDVVDRDEKNYWPSYHLKLRSCSGCFAAAKRAAAAEAESYC